MPVSDRIKGLLSPSAPASREINGIPVFLTAEQQREVERIAAATHENAWKNFFKTWPRLYEVIVLAIGPSAFTGITPRKFVRGFVPTGLVLNAGSGVQRICANCVNVDLFPFLGVDVVADLTRLPFRDGAFDGVLCEQVLEHVIDPKAVAVELERVTKPGGLIHVASPFLFPWHPSPSDYTRWTIEGLQNLFPHCELVKRGIMCGPCSALTAFAAAFLATILCFGSRVLQDVLQYFFLVLFSPIKFLDFIFAYLPGAELCAANFYIIVRKRDVQA